MCAYCYNRGLHYHMPIYIIWNICSKDSCPQFYLDSHVHNKTKYPRGKSTL